jgi:hypothetical protein
MIDAAGQGLPLDGIEVTAASFEGLDSIEVNLQVRNLSVDTLPSGLTLPDGYRVTGSWLEDERWVRIDPEEPLAYRPSTGASIHVRALELHSTLGGVVEGLLVEVPGQTEPLVEADRLEIELREPTSSLEDLYIARAQIDGLRAHVVLLDDGTPAVLGALQPDLTTGGVEVDAEPEDDEPAATPLWDDRRWFEKIPQMIGIRDGSLTVQRGDDHTLRAHSVNLDFAIRAVRPQADVDLTLAFEHAGQPAGNAALHGEWNWATEALRLDLTVEDFAIAALETPSPSLEPLELSGAVDLTTRVRERDNGTIADFSGTVAVSEFGAALGLLTNRIELGGFSFTWDAGMDEDGSLDFQVGDGRLAGADFTFTPRFQGFDYHRGRLFDTLTVRATVPDQDASTLLGAIPTTLLGDVSEARMSGTWGFEIEFPISWEETTDDAEGPRPIIINESAHFEVRDDDLHLEHLPESVDIRRLNQAFTFTFAGPDESINRTITARAPRTPIAAELIEPREGELGRANSWARLNEISYILVAATLYREDGRFFRYRGINWYQWRAVLEEAWLTRELGRGASTISMQLVKNVFLSHERSIERKLQELFLTYWMTRLVPKERILETYLNVIEWGPGINGVVEATRYYFGESPGDLTLEESVWLSSIVPAPVRRGSQRSQGVAADWSLRHCRDIITGMHSRGWITAAESEKARTSEIHFITSLDHPDDRRAPPVDVDPQDLTDLHLGVTPQPVGHADGRLSESHPQRVHSLIEGQIPLRP